MLAARNLGALQMSHRYGKSLASSSARCPREWSGFAALGCWPATIRQSYRLPRWQPAAPTNILGLCSCSMIKRREVAVNPSSIKTYVIHWSKYRCSRHTCKDWLSHRTASHEHRDVWWIILKTYQTNIIHIRSMIQSLLQFCWSYLIQLKYSRFTSKAEGRGKIMYVSSVKMLLLS